MLKIKSEKKYTSIKSIRSTLILIVCVGISLCSLLVLLLIEERREVMGPEEVLQLYASYINEHKYGEMYELLNEQSKNLISKEEFISKNKRIYEGIEARHVIMDITEIIKQKKGRAIVSYNTHMETLAGEITFSNQAVLYKDKDKKYRLEWYTQLIFPRLNPRDKVRVNRLKAERGSIYDRKGRMLAGKGEASSIGIVPGKMSKNKEADITKIAELMEVSKEFINNKLAASYVKEDTFVPIKVIAKGQDNLESELLKIKGVKIIDISIREYPFAEATSHLTGYIQNISAEDLEKLKDKGYHSDSVIGKSGLEKIYEEHLRGIDGYEIVIVDEENKEKQVLATKEKKNGNNLRLTIDAELQKNLYDQFMQDKSCSVAMNPKTGEVLALVSTPSFDANDFVLGMSKSKWEMLNNDINKPLYNRFKATLCPGSGFKSVIGAIGLTTGQIKLDDNYGDEGLSWQKSSKWGGYKITTLKNYGSQVVLKNALIYSDNIYFAKAALNIGADILAEQLDKIGFNETIPFEVELNKSTFSNTGRFESEIQLADSGYGQAQILINPIHMATIYSAFVNDGNMIKPYLKYQSTPETKYWKEEVFTKEAANTLKDNLVEVVEKAGGGIAKVEGLTLAGKTGTAEIKQSQDDQRGTELGWFNVFTVDKDKEDSLLMISMVEDVKGRGGAGYVIPKVKEVFKSRQ